MRIVVCADERKASALRQALPQAEVVSSAEISADFGVADAVFTPLTSDIRVLRQLDMRDGLTKVVGAVDTIALQPTGSNYLTIGFTTLSGALARAANGACARGATGALGQAASGVLSQVARDDDGAGYTNCAILGAGEAASASLAAAVQLHAKHTVLVAQRSIGPGSAIAAAHRMGLSIPLVKPDEADLVQADLVIVTDPEISAQMLTQISPQATVIDVADAARSCAEQVTCYVSRRDVDVVQLGDQIRILTSVQPDLAEIDRLYPVTQTCG